MKRIAFHRWLVSLALLIAVSAATYAQTSVTITLVSGDTASAALKPTIKMTTHKKIDAYSITHGYGAGHDSSAPTPYNPTMTLLPMALADTLADSLWKFHAINGTYVQVNDTILKFTPSENLVFGTTYLARIGRLRVVKIIGGVPDTVAADNSAAHFTTTLPVHHVLQTSVDSTDHIRCHDTFSVTLNRKLASPSTVGSQILSLVHLDSMDINADSTPRTVTSSVSASTWLGSDSTQIFLRPSSALTPGERYILRVKPSLLNGDTTSDVSVPLVVMGSYKLLVEAVPANPLDTLPPGIVEGPGIGEQYIQAGDTAALGTSEGDSTFVFSHWASDDDPSVDGNENYSLDIHQSCEGLHDVLAKAVFVRRDSIDVDVTAGSHLHASVYSQSLSHLGGAGTYRIGPWDQLYVANYPDSGYRLGYWNSNAPGYDGSSSTLLKIRNRGTDVSVGSTGEAESPVLCESYGLCVQRWVENWWDLTFTGLTFSSGDDPDGVITVSPSDPGCHYYPSSTAQSVTGTINNECYCIKTVVIRPPFVEPIFINVGCASSYTIPVAPTCPATIVDFIAEPTSFTQLTVASVLDPKFDGSRIGLNTAANGADVTAGAWKVDRNYVRGPFFGYDNSTLTNTTGGAKYAAYTVDVACSSRVVFQELHNQRTELGFHFNGWTTGAGFTVPTLHALSAPPNTPKTYMTRMNSTPTTVQAEFEEDGFILRQIGLWHLGNTTSEPTWYSPRLLATMYVDDLNVWLSTDDGQPFGTKVAFRFNSPIDRSLLGSNRIGSSPLYCVDESERMDPDNYTGLGAYTVSDDSYAESDKRITITLDSWITGNDRMPKGETFSIVAKNWLEGTNSERLSNPGTWSVGTVMPGIHIQLESIEPLGSKGDGDPEPFVICTSSITGVIPSTQKMPDMTFPPTWPIGTLEYFDSYKLPTASVLGSSPWTLSSKSRTKRTDQTHLRLEGRDYDPWPNSDDGMGEQNFGYYGKLDWFGARPTLWLSQSIPGSDVDAIGYNVRFKLY